MTRPFSYIGRKLIIIIPLPVRAAVDNKSDRTFVIHYIQGQTVHSVNMKFADSPDCKVRREDNESGNLFNTRHCHVPAENNNFRCDLPTVKSIPFHVDEITVIRVAATVHKTECIAFSVKI